MSSKFGQKYAVTAYVPETIFQKINELRGDESRSGYIGEILVELFGTE